MSPANPNRQPPGTPVGGQFAARASSEAAHLALVPDERAESSRAELHKTLEAACARVEARTAEATTDKETFPLPWAFGALPPAEVAAAQSVGLDPGNYQVFRKSGATHDELRAAHLAGIDPYVYGAARWRRATNHEELMAAHQAGVNNLIGFADARTNGATAAEVMEAHAGGANLHDYAVARNFSEYEDGATHQEAMEAHAAGIDLDNYARELHHGSTHEEIVADAADKCVREFENQPVLAPGEVGWRKVWGANVSHIRAGDIVLTRSGDAVETSYVADTFESKSAPMRRGFVDGGGKRFTLGAMNAVIVVRKGTHNTLA
jgi:hypothetical protein